MKILVTGVEGFIGSHFARHAIARDNIVIGHTRHTQGKHYERIADTVPNGNFNLVCGDITKEISDIMMNVDVVVNFAAKTFVDHSILDPHPFIRSNFLGTYNLLNQAVKCKVKRFIQVSTDEVYGTMNPGDYAQEQDELRPTNPYSATKAAADMLAISYFHTYDLPIIITRCENNYGPYQGSEKAIPTFIRHAMKDRPLPVYGDGKHRRQWLHVDDHVDALYFLITRGHAGQIYNVGGNVEKENLSLAEDILLLTNSEAGVEFVEDHDIRPGHDRRYAMATDKINALGWKAKMSYQDGLSETVEWYKNNERWLR